MHEESLWMRMHPETHIDLKKLLILILYSFIPVLAFCFSPYKSWHFLWSWDKVLYQVWPLFLKLEAPVGISSSAASLCCSFWWKCEKIMTWSFVTIDHVLRHPQVNEYSPFQEKGFILCFSEEYAIGVEILSHLHWFPTKQGCAELQVSGHFPSSKQILFLFPFLPKRRAADTMSQPLLSLLPSL